MKTAEKEQVGFSGPGLSPPTSNRGMKNTAGKRWLGAVLLGLGVIFAVPLIMIMIPAISGSSPETTQTSEQGINALICGYALPPHWDAHWEANRVTFTTGRGMLVLATFESPITLEDKNRIEQEVLDRAKVELGEPPHLISPRAISQTEPESRLVAFGFAIYVHTMPGRGSRWVPTTYLGSAGCVDTEKCVMVASCVEAIHREAKEWFKGVASQTVADCSN